jgi:cysteinyl-tRNA synthetase
MYTCGPTVYRYIHIGNIRAFLTADVMRRALTAQGYEVRHIKNITDVGHMRQDQVEQGEDKVIAQALAEGKTPWEIAQFYTEAFLQDEAKANILPAQVFPRATDHVQEMIAIVQTLLERGHAYTAGGNIYFDVSSFDGYGRLSGNLQETLLAGVRSDADPLKRSPADFTLWKASEPGRVMQWPSPWGQGFPGWHIECSAMSTKYLGEQLDIHTGGVDNIFPHHEGEIAQSEAAFGKQFVRYWVHCQHVLAAGQKMAKSAGNAYTLSDLEERGFESLAYRYLCLTSHYRSRLNFTFTALVAAQRALDRLRHHALIWARSVDGMTGDEARMQAWRSRFWDAVNDDLATPQALATVWGMVGDGSLTPEQKLALALEFDQVLGLDLQAWTEARRDVPSEVREVLLRRDALRRRADFVTADTLRTNVIGRGLLVEDLREGSQAVPVPQSANPGVVRLAHAIPSGKVVPSRLDEPSTLDLSVVIAASGWPEDVTRVVEDTLQQLGGRQAEIIVIDNGTFDGTWEVLDEIADRDPRLLVLHTDHYLGDAAAKNIGFKQAIGRVVVVLDTSVGLDGDVFAPLLSVLEDPQVGMVGTWGLVTENFKDFEEVAEGEVDALQAYCFAFRREDLRRVGLMDERFIFYRNLDIDFSFQFREQGFRVVAMHLPLTRYVHRAWESLAPGEREKKSKRNWTRFFEKYHHRADLLVTPGAPGYVHPEGDAHSGHDH